MIKKLKQSYNKALKDNYNAEKWSKNSNYINKILKNDMQLKLYVARVNEITRKLSKLQKRLEKELGRQLTDIERLQGFNMKD